MVWRRQQQQSRPLLWLMLFGRYLLSSTTTSTSHPLLFCRAFLTSTSSSCVHRPTRRTTAAAAASTRIRRKRLVPGIRHFFLVAGDYDRCGAVSLAAAPEGDDAVAAVADAAATTTTGASDDRTNEHRTYLQTFFSFRLDDWQVEAGAAILNGHNVIVCAPTGAGSECALCFVVGCRGGSERIVLVDVHRTVNR
jgi:hypothetical protein